MKTYIQEVVVFCLIVIGFMFSVVPVSAASTVMSVSPGEGTYKEAFTVDIVIDGHDDVFNAAKATVVTSQNLYVKDLELGDCKFSFTTTPSLANPSFEGVLLGSSTKKCTVYTMTLLPIKDGAADVTISNASVLRFGDAVNVLSSSQNAKYTVTAVTNPPSPRPTPKVAGKDDPYNVAFIVDSANGARVGGAKVTISPPDKSSSQEQTTDANGEVHFKNLKAGVYAATAESGSFSQDTILNLSGRNHDFSLHLKLEKKAVAAVVPGSSSKMLTPDLIGKAFAAVVIIFMIVYFINQKRKKSPST